MNADERPPCGHAFHTYCDDPLPVTEADTEEITRLLAKDDLTREARDMIETVNEAYAEGYDRGYADASDEGCDCTGHTLRWWEWGAVALIGLLSGYGVLVTGVWLWLG